MVAPCLVALAIALRIWPLGALKLRIPYITFYPAVVVAALYGGVTIGFLATALSALAAGADDFMRKPANAEVLLNIQNKNLQLAAKIGELSDAMQHRQTWQILGIHDSRNGTGK